MGTPREMPVRSSRARSTSHACGRSRPARSAIVHATRSTLSRPRAVSRPRSMSRSAAASAPDATGQRVRSSWPGTSQLTLHGVPCNRAAARSSRPVPVPRRLPSARLGRLGPAGRRGRPARLRRADRRGRAAVRTAAPGSGGSPTVGIRIRRRAGCAVRRGMDWPRGPSGTWRAAAPLPRSVPPPHARIRAAAEGRPAPCPKIRESRQGTARPGAPATPRRAAAVRYRHRRATASSPNGAARSRAAYVPGARPEAECPPPSAPR